MAETGANNPAGSHDGVCWVNGRIVDADDGSVSAMDHSIVVGDGVFETLKAVDGPDGPVPSPSPATWTACATLLTALAWSRPTRAGCVPPLPM